MEASNENERLDHIRVPAKLLLFGLVFFFFEEQGFTKVEEFALAATFNLFAQDESFCACI